jgi:cell division protein FtsB
MAWLRKKPDPLSGRARALNQEIAQLEDQIKRMGAQVERDRAHPRLRSTALPHGSTVSHPGAGAAPASPAPATAAHEPIFEEVDQGRLESSGESIIPPEHYNELGVRKYDLPALLRRLRSFFQGPSATNPKLISYLAAGGIQGLRPLRYEKRKARRRFIFLVAVLFLLVLGTFLGFYRRR